MKWTSVLSRRNSTEAAVAEVVLEIKSKLGTLQPDLAFLFLSPQHRDLYPRIGPALRKELGAKHLLGCSGGGVIGAGVEAEKSPAISLTAAVMPNVEIQPVRMVDSSLPDLDSGPKAWQDALNVKASTDPQFVLLADPFSIRAEELLAGLDFAFPNSVKVGGLASGGRGPGQNVLYLDDQVFHDGAVALALSGDVKVDALVAQGCRPIGNLYKVTKCHRHLLLELDKRRALDVLGEMVHEASEKDRDIIRNTNLFVGLVMDPFKAEPPGPGDFLIRHLMGMDEKRGVLAIGSMLREGQHLQFHIFDKEAASEDLGAVLRRYSTEQLNATRGETLPPPPRGALLFSCLGRGLHLYGRPNHDTEAFQAQLGDVPLAGFFCNGEIGPVGANTYVHGWTSCFGIFRTK